MKGRSLGLHAEAGGVEDHHVVHPVALPRGQEQGHRTAHAVARRSGPSERRARPSIRAPRRRRSSKERSSGCDDAPKPGRSRAMTSNELRERPDHVGPGVDRRGQAVDQDHGRALALADVADVETADPDGARLEAGARQPLAGRRNPAPREGGRAATTAMRRSRTTARRTNFAMSRFGLTFRSAGGSPEAPCARLRGRPRRRWGSCAAASSPSRPSRARSRDRRPKVRPASANAAG